MMNVLLKKLKIENERRRLRKEARRIRDSAENIYWHELAKPSAERDEQLMAECLRTMKYSSTVFAGGENCKRVSFGTVVRKAAAALCVIIVLAAASTGVAYAMGFNVWDFIINIGNDGIDIAGTATDEKDGDRGQKIDFDSVEDTDGFEECGSIEEALQKLSVKPAIFDLTNKGMMIDNIYIAKNAVVMELQVQYVNDDDYVDYCVQMFRDSDTSFVTSVVGEFDDYEIVEMNGGITLYVVNGDHENAVAWESEGYIYKVYGNIESKELIGLVEDLYS